MLTHFMDLSHSVAYLCLTNLSCSSPDSEILRAPEGAFLGQLLPPEPLVTRRPFPLEPTELKAPLPQFQGLAW